MNLEGDHRICFVGDSFVQGTGDPEYQGWVGRVASAARASGFNLTAYNLGVRRETSQDILKRWQAECAVRLPDDCTRYVVFSFGANDMTLEHGSLRVSESDSVANFVAIVAGARSNYSTLIIGPIPVGDSEQDSRILRLCSIYAEKAAELGVPYLPVANQLITNAVWQAGAAANDGSHPGTEGYAFLAAKVLKWPVWWF